jgi:curved DNA-binding protein CbpA
MNLNSKYFDRIRINPGGPKVSSTEASPCQWHGCGRAGGYRAPKGRMAEGEYHNFCLDHVREYNKSYNYFAGMRDDDVAAYQRSSSTGHRPTWTMAAGAAAAGGEPKRGWSESFTDPFGFFGGSFGRKTEAAEPQRRPLKNLERRSFAALDLEGTETGDQIKARYKMLVKRFHPDANGGDRALEDELRQIIQAYHYLKSVGFC